MKNLSRLLIIIGIILFALGMYQVWLHYDPNRLAFSNYDFAKNYPATAKNLPRRIIIKNLHINLPIIPSRVTNKVWETTDNGASYLLSSPPPGNKGNSVIYAHNWLSLFGNLVSAQPGEKVEIDFANNSKKIFVITETSTVSPTQSTILAPSKDNRITLYTCTGFFDSKRFVAVAVLDDKLSENSSN